MLESNVSRIMFGAGVIVAIVIVTAILMKYWPEISSTIHEGIFNRGVFIK